MQETGQDVREATQNALFRVSFKSATGQTRSNTPFCVTRPFLTGLSQQAEVNSKVCRLVQQELRGSLARGPNDRSAQVVGRAVANHVVARDVTRFGI